MCIPNNLWRKSNKMQDMLSAVERVELLREVYQNRGLLDTDLTAIIEGIYRSSLSFPQDKKSINVLLVEANEGATASLESHLFDVFKTLTWCGEGQINFQRRSELGVEERNNYDLYFVGPTINSGGKIVDSRTVEENIRRDMQKGKRESRLVFFYQLERTLIQPVSLEKCFPIDVLIASASQYPEYRRDIAAYLTGLTVGDVVDVTKRPEFEKWINRPAFNIVGTPSKEDLIEDPSKYPADIAIINLMCIQKPLLDELQLPLIKLYRAANPNTFVRATVNEHQLHTITRGEPHPSISESLVSNSEDSRRYRELEGYCRSVRLLAKELRGTSPSGLEYFHFLRPDISLLAQWGDHLALPKVRKGENPICASDVENFYYDYAYSLVDHFLSGGELYRLLNEKARQQSGLNLQYGQRLTDTTRADAHFRTPAPYLITAPIVFAGPSVAGKSITVAQLDDRKIDLERGRMDLRATEKYITRYDISTVPSDVLMGLGGQKITMLSEAEFESFWHLGKFLIRYTHFGQNYAVPSDITNLIRDGKSPMVILNQDGVNNSKQHDFFSNAIYFLLYCSKHSYERRLSERPNRDDMEMRERMGAWEFQMIQYDHAIEGYDVVLETSPHVLLDDDKIIRSEENPAVQRVIEALQYEIRKDTHHAHIDNLLGKHFMSSMDELEKANKKRGGRKVPIEHIDWLIKRYADMKGIKVADLRYQIPRYVSAVINWHGVYEIVLARPVDYDEHPKQHLISFLSMLFGTPSEKVEHVVFEGTSSFSYCKATSGKVLLDRVASFGFWDRFIPEPTAPVRNLAFSIANVGSKLAVGTDVRSCDLYMMTNPEIRGYKHNLLDRIEQMRRTSEKI